MGKRRIQTKGVRQQVRTVRPKPPPVPTTQADQKKQREKYVASGGLLQGYAPDFVMRIGYIGAGIAAVCLLLMLAVLFGPIRPSGWPVRIIAAIAWLVPVFVLASFVGPGFRLARRDRKQEARVVQGQLLGASSVSTSLGLGMLMLKTRAGQEQLLVAPDKLTRVPGNVVNVIANVTPNLKHVKSLSIMGQRMMPRPEPPTPPVLKRLRLLPIITPVALVVAVVIGSQVAAFVPIANDFVHALVVIVVAVALAGAVYGISIFMQRRLMSEVQALLPAGSLPG